MNDIKKKISWYKLKFEQLMPIHIGKKNYGVLSETRLFIPGWTMWGALVNSYGKLNGGKDKDFNKGKELFEKITCFYPTKNNKNPLFPKFKGEKLYIGDISEKEFRRRFTDTYVSTAVEPEYFAAKDASFHEIEIILPKEKYEGICNDKSKNKKENFVWIGLVGIKQDKENNFQEFLGKTEEIYVGGDVVYGFGKMKLNKKRDSEFYKVDKDTLKKWGLNSDGSINDSKEGIKNYLEFNNGYELKKGKLEFIVQYDFSKKTPIIETKGYYFVPGSEIYKDETNNKRDSSTLKKGLFPKLHNDLPTESL